MIRGDSQSAAERQATCSFLTENDQPANGCEDLPLARKQERRLQSVRTPRITTICEETREIQRLIIAGETLKQFS